jgi:pimeloyl-ACP methyl ester carboxylesterase
MNCLTMRTEGKCIYAGVRGANIKGDEMSEYTINLRSKILAGPIDVNVIMPNPASDILPKDFYNSKKRYKVLFILHGGNGEGRDLIRYTNIARYAEERECILVMPSGLNSDFANHPEFADGFNFTDFFFDELMPFIHNWFPASGKSGDNFLAGYSMGGAAVWMLGLLHPELFGGIAPLSSPPRNYDYLESYRSLSSAEFRAKAKENPLTFPSGYGNPKNGILYKEINMIAKYPTVGAFLDSCEHTWARFSDAARSGKIPNIFAATGGKEHNAGKMIAFKEYAIKLGISAIELYIDPNFGHEFAFWDQALLKAMDHFNINKGE